MLAGGLVRRHQQLARIRRELEDAGRGAHDVAALVDEEQWSARPGPDQWSVAECLVHLNLTSQAFRPLIRDALGRARASDPSSHTGHRMDLLGRLLWLALTIRVPIKTPEPFVPLRAEPRDAVLSEFDALQRKMIDCANDAEGVDLGRARIVSPFDSRLTYNLYSCLRVIPAHQRLHLRQAEEVVRALRATERRGGSR